MNSQEENTILTFKLYKPLIRCKSCGWESVIFNIIQRENDSGELDVTQFDAGKVYYCHMCGEKQDNGEVSDEN